MFRNLRSFIFLCLLSIVLLSFVFFSLIALPSIRKTAESQIRDQLLVHARMSENIISGLIESGAPASSFQKEAVELSKASGNRVTVINSKGIVLADSDEPASKVSIMENHLTKPEVAQSVTEPYGFSVRYSSTTRRDQVYVSRAIKDSDNKLK